MSAFVELDLAPALAATLESYGYSPEHPAWREQLPAAIRGTNLALACPPAARYAVPALAGLAGALRTGGRALVLVPAHALAEWTAVLLPLAGAAGRSALVARQPARAIRRFREGRLEILLATPATALALHERSALKPEQLGHVVLAWPELFDADEALSSLMQDVPAEAQRILVLAAPRPGHPMLERYARRALVIGPLAGAEAVPPAGPAVRMALVAWSRRAEALAALIEAEDPESLTVWCADRRSVTMAEAALPVGDKSIQAVTGAVPRSALVVAWDLPAPAELAALSAAGEVVLFVPPHAASYVTQITSRQTPVRLRGALDEARDEAARRRGMVQAEIDRGDLDGELLSLAPLFERHDPARVAAAVFRLWRRRPVEPGTVEPAAAPVGATEVLRLWVGVGKKDGATPADLVAALAREVGVPAARIGRVEIRELFSLVEVPAGEAEAIARQLTGKTIRRRRVVAKVDRGRPTDGSRGPSGPSPRERRARPKP